MNYTLDYNISKDDQVTIARVNGKIVAITNLEDNPAASQSRKGEWYLHFSIIERKQVADDGQTHFGKKNVSSETYKAMSEEEKRAIPIILSMKEQRSRGESAPAAPVVDVQVDAVEGDMPF